jgi:hypothetical protein
MEWFRAIDQLCVCVCVCVCVCGVQTILVQTMMAKICTMVLQDGQHAASGVECVREPTLQAAI